MKTLSRCVLAILALTSMASAALAAGPSYQIEVAGLSCPFCAYGIEKKLTAIVGVERVETNIRAGTVTVTMKDGTRLDRATAERAVKAAGFTLKEIRPLPAGSSQ